VRFFEDEGVLYHDLYVDINVTNGFRWFMASAGQFDPVYEKIGDAGTGKYQLDANDQRRLWPREKIHKVWSEPPSSDYLQVFVSLPAGLGSPTLQSDKPDGSSLVKEYCHAYLGQW
jgi:hypothetical protein